MKENTTGALSQKAFEELKIIATSELSSPMSDAEIEEMGLRLLRLFSILSVGEPQPITVKVTDQELKGLQFLYDEIHQHHRSPSVRAFSKAMGFRSSRSGFQLLEKLLTRGWMRRHPNGALQMGIAITRFQSESQTANVNDTHFG